MRIVWGALFAVMVTAFGGCFGRSALDGAVTDSSVAGRAGVESAPAGNGGTRTLGTPRAPAAGGDASTAAARSVGATGGSAHGDGEGGVLIGFLDKDDNFADIQIRLKSYAGRMEELD